MKKALGIEVITTADADGLFEILLEFLHVQFYIDLLFLTMMFTVGVGLPTKPYFKYCKTNVGIITDTDQ